jgi:hypothetical protein
MEPTQRVWEHPATIKQLSAHGTKPRNTHGPDYVCAHEAVRTDINSVAHRVVSGAHGTLRTTAQRRAPEHSATERKKVRVI